ncbi:hypothetical protein [Pseudomonas monteilii]|uniref:hypothetical protein n=1 Tax=Pseudomonas monteilii TaxID=76759 RepID=UPI0007616365|nr:hypothetical protein [Pseudomonas monteilii]
MRVPVFADDLAPKSGLKRLERALQKRWCGPNRIKLSFAREVLSRGLGYRDYRDLRNATKLAQPGAPAPKESEVRLGIYSAIKAALKPEEWFASDPSAWERLVAALPVNVLLAFKSPVVVRLHNSHLHPFERLAAQWAEHGTAEIQQLISEKLERIHSSVTASGNLRDAALLACLMSGMRPNDFLPAKVKNIASFTDEILIEVKTLKASRYGSTRRFYINNPVAIQSYIKAESLSNEDYLFSAAGKPECPMTSAQLRKISASWAVKAGIDPSTLSLSRIRNTAILMKFIESQKNFGTMAEWIKLNTGHTSQDTLTYYLNKELSPVKTLTRPR